MLRDDLDLALSPADESNGSSDALLRAAADIDEPTDMAATQLGIMPGDVLCERFLIERLAGTGGMGTIHRALDLATQQPVAIKMMLLTRRVDVARFAQEVMLLAQLSHPCVVRYVAHGVSPQGTPFLAMEWLDGLDLSQRLSRAALSVTESLSIARRAAEGLAAAHACGVVHRDLKPSNLFLVADNPRETKVLDFGIARHTGGQRTLTQAGAILGTVGYMSPEQARGVGVDARADVFALGCVLFECLTGRPAFAGPTPVAVLAKVLCEDPPRVSELSPGLSERLDVFVASLLAKSPEARPKDAAALLSALSTLGDALGEPSTSPRATGLTRHEQHIVSVIVGAVRAQTTPANDFAERATVREPESVEVIAGRFGAQVVALRGGRWLIVLSGGAATDQASQAAACALALRRARPDLQLCVATGRAETDGRLPIGAAIDGAAQLLRSIGAQSKGVALDELTAGLLDARFEVVGQSGRLSLLGMRTDGDATWLLMGRPTPFVGREKELGLCELTLRECLDASVARAVLVTGPAGQGKSRLRQELVTRVRDIPELRILSARAVSVSAGSAFVLARQLIWSAAALREADSPAQQQADLRDYLTTLCQAADLSRIADFLGEMLGIASADAPSPELRAARNDPSIMSGWLRRSFREWIAAESQAHPLLIVLEDLHWGDLPSVTWLGDALRLPAGHALMLLALARDEVRETFPGLWSGLEMIELPLGRLTARAATRLLRETLGSETRPELEALILERADGNPFYLSELLRCVAEGNDTPPATVTALLQTRLERLEPETRRLARAASIYGQTFVRDGLAHVLGAGSAVELEHHVQELLRLELFVAAEPALPHDAALRFRHDLVREAAYGMLIPTDLARGHALAVAWLEEHARDTDPLIFAHHFERAGQADRAVPWLCMAARRAVDGGSVSDALAITERGEVCGAVGAEGGTLLLLRAQALGMRSDWARALVHAQAAMERFQVGSPNWFISASSILAAGSFLGDRGAVATALQAMLGTEVRPEPSGPYGLAIFLAVHALTHAGPTAPAWSLLERAEAVPHGAADLDPTFTMWLFSARAYLEFLDRNPGASLRHFDQAKQLARSTEASFGGAMADMMSIVVCGLSGDMKRAEEAAREAIAFSRPFGIHIITRWSTFFLMFARVAVGQKLEAVEAPLRLLVEDPDSRLGVAAHALLAEALLEAGKRDEALRMVTQALTNAEPYPREQALALRSRALIELALGRAEEALASAARGLALVGAPYPAIASTLRIVQVDALRALDRAEEARALIQEIRASILAEVATLDPPERDACLTRVVAYARVMSFA